MVNTWISNVYLILHTYIFPPAKATKKRKISNILTLPLFGQWVGLMNYSFTGVLDFGGSGLCLGSLFQSSPYIGPDAPLSPCVKEKQLSALDP